MKHIALLDIDKYFPSSGTWADKKARLELSSGEIHAVVGENGAGKTTLMRVLAGLERPDAGSISIDGTAVFFRGPADASKRGIGMVHQHFLTIPGFSTAENIVFGSEPRAAGLFIDRGAVLKEARRAIGRFGFFLDPAAPADSLTIGERQQMEILRLLYRDCEVLILDEPTSVLTEQEIGALFATLRRLKAMGRTIVIITHKIKEVKEIADRVTVMRSGETLGEFEASELSEYDLSRMIMGGAVRAEQGPHRSARPALPAKPILEIERLALRPRHRGPATLTDISLEVRPGEICGVCALSGNGLSELEDVLAGLLKPSGGRLAFMGGPYPSLRTAPWRPRGIGYVPSDRMRRGSCAGRTVSENFIALDRAAFFPGGILDAGAARAAASAAIGAFSIKAEPDSLVAELSGGSVQKMILARELSDPPPPLCILCEPTWGLDTASTAFAYDRILSLREKGSAIVLLSSDLDEIMALSDRIIALHKGTMAGSMVNGSEATREALGALMLGLEKLPARTGSEGGLHE